jgi:hypothetical protein
MSKRSTARSKKDEQEVLSSPVNLDGSGEDPAVRALLSNDFVQGTNAEAVEIGMALQQIIRGQAALMENQAQFSDEIARIRQRMNEMDKAAERWNNDRESFVQEVLDRAESLKATGSEKDRILANGGNQFTEAITRARAEQVSDNMKFEQSLRDMPKVTIVSPGELVMVSEGGRQVAKIMNETVKIKTHKWTLPAGKAVEVPLAVAKVLDERRRLQAETEARQNLLAQHPESSVLDRKWKEINSKFNSTTDTLPTA